MKTMLTLVLSIALSGCATLASRMNQLSVGMDKAAVIEVMGDPHSTGAIGGREVLSYSLQEYRGGYREPYVVLIENGKVLAFGHQDSVFPPSAEVLQARASQAEASAQRMMQYQQMKAREPAQQQNTYRQNLDMLRGNRTSCQSRNVGGTVYTDCK